MKRRLDIFRFIGIVEGASLVLLVFVAMPLKYFFDMPMAVTIVGAIHGYIFLTYCVAIVLAMIFVRWPFRFTIGAFAVAFIPFGNFILDSRLKKLAIDKGWQKPEQNEIAM